ncbi:MAG: DUF349 domain-containing protein [Flavobacterium sp.]|nr:DUF349 domain-containing protein [Flavobacterium sp.]
MLEETNDNLSNSTETTDGNAKNQATEQLHAENDLVEIDINEFSNSVAADVKNEIGTEIEEEIVHFAPIELADNEILDPAEENVEIANEVEEEIVHIIPIISEGEVINKNEVKSFSEISNNTVIEREKTEANANDAMELITAENAAESEDITLKERHDIEMLDYEAFTMEDLIAELEKLTAVEKVMSVKDHVEGIKNAFLQKFYQLLEEKKEAFETENNDPDETFNYQSPLKQKFDILYTTYKNRKNTHFKSLQNDLKTNLETREALVEELKNLIHKQDNIGSSLKQFNDIRDRWKNAGAIPKDKYNHVWNNYHFHIENFYDILHLDREARDIDFKHNLVLKLNIIVRCEELVQEIDVNKAFRELQDLHKIWKEDIGPVSREQRDEIWIKFSDLTKQMHDKRDAIFEILRASENENLEKKTQIISQLQDLANQKVDSHNNWSLQVAKVEALRESFFAIGKVPNEVNEETWQKFKIAVKNFNLLKNSFYKDIKKDQNDNLHKKQALIAKAKELQDSTDFAVTTPIMKQIQEDWKTIGHVPRNVSDKLWKQFREACNHYFEKLKEQKNEENAEEVIAFEKKKEFMETLREFAMTGDHKTDLDAIKLHIENWKSFGRVPAQRRHIEGKFNKILDALFEKLSLSKKDTEIMRFANRMEQFSENNDTRKLENEKVFLMRKIEEVQSEIFQLENNIQFFTNTRNAKKENSIVLEVRKNIEKHREELVILREKLKQLRTIKQE